MADAIVFEVNREGYSIDQVKHPLTVGELRNILDDFDDDDIIILSHDRGYTYGSLPYRYKIVDSENDEEMDEDYDE